MKFYKDLTLEQLLKLWQKEELRRKANAPTVLFHNAYTPAVQHYRWYDDDAGEAASTTLANQDTTYNVDVSAGNVILQLRTLLEETGGDTNQSNNTTIQLRYNDGTNNSVTATSNKIQATPDVTSNLTDDGATTNRGPDAASGGLDDGAGTFVTGVQEAGNGSFITQTEVTAGNFTEYVFAITVVAADVSDNDTITLDFTEDGTAPTFNVTPTLTITKGAVTTNRANTDTLFLRDPRQSDLQKLRTESILLSDTRMSQKLKTVMSADGLQLDDELKEKILDQLIADPFLLSDNFTKDLEKTLEDAFLLASSSAIQKIMVRALADGLFVDDFHTNAIARLIQSLLLIGDSVSTQQTAAGLVRTITDQLLLGSSTTTTLSTFAQISWAELELPKALVQIFTVLKTDKLLINDLDLRVRDLLFREGILIRDDLLTDLDKQLIDAVLFADETFKIVEKFHLDNLLIGDASTIEEFAAQVIVRTATDKLLLLDKTIKAQETTKVDSLLLGDEILKDLLNQIFDQLLLIDSVLAEKGKFVEIRDNLPLSDTATRLRELLQEDNFQFSDEFNFLKELNLQNFLLVSDSQFLEVDKNIAEAIFILDSIQRIIDRAVEDNILLGDSITTEKTAGFIIIQRQATDRLLLLSEQIKEVELTKQNSLLLADQRVSEQLHELINSVLLYDQHQTAKDITVTDALLMRDNRFLQLEILQRDSLLIKELANNIRELLITEGLLIDDSIASTTIRALIEALVWALLSTKDLLGSSVAVENNFLGLDEAQETNVDFLAASIAIEEEFLKETIDFQPNLLNSVLGAQVPSAGPFN